ncbi:gamma-butyrobetaine hydroxylase-like domain-containing protein [Alphaproteobacteria bacterium]|nr:gamma-butyrobetaine hydroxylase-like domain-containing protein [Alphaproteobacteria bacterium]
MLDNNKARSIIYNKLKKTLTIEFCDNYKAEISAELLRVESPSAEVQGHSSKNKKTPLNKKNVAINQIERVGNYAIKIIFDDSHDTGIYSWAYLREMSENNIKLYEDYLNRVAKISAT